MAGVVDRITVSDGTHSFTADRHPTGWPRNAFSTSKGLDGGWGANSTKTQRSGRAGVTVSGWRRPGREITIGGAWQGTDPDQARRFIDTLDAIGATGQLVTLTRQTSRGLRTLTTVLDGEADITAHLSEGMGTVQWELPLYAADPIWYGPAVTVQASVAGAGYGLTWPLFDPDGLLDWGSSSQQEASLANPGSLDAWPTVLVEGNLPSGFSLADTISGVDVVYRGAVTPLAGVEIDFAAGTARTRGGGWRTELVTGRGFWPVPAGGFAAPALASLQQGGSGTATITIRPAWA